MEFIAISCRYCVQNETTMFFVVAAWGVQCGHCDAVARINWRKTTGEANNAASDFVKSEGTGKPSVANKPEWQENLKRMMSLEEARLWCGYNPIHQWWQPWPRFVLLERQGCALQIRKRIYCMSLRYCNEPLDGLLSKKMGYEEDWLLSPVPLRLAFQCALFGVYMYIYIYSGLSKIVAVYCTKMTIEDKHYIITTYRWPKPVSVLHCRLWRCTHSPTSPRAHEKDLREQDEGMDCRATEARNEWPGFRQWQQDWCKWYPDLGTDD